MKNTLGGIKSSREDAKDWISALQDGIVENKQAKQQKEKRILKVRRVI